MPSGCRADRVRFVPDVHFKLSYIHSQPGMGWVTRYKPLGRSS
jgi:hypothetical protein